MKINKHKTDTVDEHYIDNINDPGELFLVLVKIMEKLRSDNGCLWDREQTHESIKKNLIEEAYEAVASIEEADRQDLKEELGDILLQVVFHSQIASGNHDFNINDVIRTIIKKLIRRHPHVFGDRPVKSSDEVLSNWEDIKKAERKKKDKAGTSIFSNIPVILPALHYAYEIQNRASRLGFDWDSVEGVIEKVNEEVAELHQALHPKSEIAHDKSKISYQAGKTIYPEAEDKIQGRARPEIPGDIPGIKPGAKVKLAEEVGDLLFSIVNLSRHLQLDSEQCLRDTCKKFISRFDYMEEYAGQNGIDFKSLSLPEKEKLWEMAKNELHIKKAY